MKTLSVFTFMLAFIGINEAAGQWTTSGTNIYNTNTGFVGIGSSSPGTLLHVQKNMTEPAITIQNLGGIGGATYRMTDNISGADWKFKATNAGGFKIRDNANGLDVFMIEPNSSANALYINSDGNIGIGTSSPTSKFEVAGRNIELSNYVFLGCMYSGVDLLLGSNMKAIDDENARGAYVANNWPYGYSGIKMYHGDIQFHTKEGQVYEGNTAASVRMRIDPNGNVGIGTSTPNTSALLDISSTTKGVLLPRMTQTQIGDISDPANGLQVFCTTDCKMYIFVANANGWKEVAYGTGTIALPFSCGSSITKNHVAGAVAPVNKTVTYGTVTNIPGEPSKCWITSNLGADHQATAKNDATEASAGWYWKFNRMQGYKHDGSYYGGVTPSWTIITIDENTDWIAANDPCTLELGIGWRLPTNTEWEHVNYFGGWANWNGPWNSGLKMHAAGAIQPSSNGDLGGRGSDGQYWSSSQDDNTYGSVLSFNSGYCSMYDGWKDFGNSVRCLRD